ncbi:MAG: GWxTD domain-containing protein [Acidobacteriota bacterium]|nr:GWxTD domain-containing protein [Acidobacteriota bacterium]MDQ7088319.1 GWxTD domain-containing protein [Acidobacteriota bacterium]
MNRRGSTFRGLVGSLVLLALLLAAPFAPAAKGRKGHQPTSLREWHKGPVRYLMNRSEARLYRRLDSTAERLAFIRRFWDRRDPDPRTPANEARLTFWARVAEANRKFDDTPLPGWKTDRGKIYILLGPPNDTEQRQDYDTGERNTINRGLLRWHYQGLQNAATRAHTVIAFVRDDDNDWRLTRDPRLNSVFLDINDVNSTEGLPKSIERLIRNVPWGGGTLATAMDLGRLQEVPTEADLLRAVVRAEAFVGSYQGTFVATPITTPAGDSLLALTLAVARSDLAPAWDGSAMGLSSRLAATAELRPLGEPDGRPARIEFDEAAFGTEPAPASRGDAWLRLQAVKVVPPGRWKLSALVFDRRGGGAAPIYGEVRVPAPQPAAPRFTGPLLARRIEDPARDGQEYSPFRIHGSLVVPRLDTELSADDPFALFVEVTPPPDAPQVPILEWQLERADNEQGPYQPLGAAGRDPHGLGPRAWRLPAGKLEPGHYRIRFGATLPGGERTERVITFVVR